MRTLSLRTVGRKTGTPRGTPLYYVDDGPNMAIVTSNAGRDRGPAWWLNLQAQPDAEVEIRKETHRIRARPATPPSTSGCGRSSLRGSGSTRRIGGARTGSS